MTVGQCRDATIIEDTPIAFLNWWLSIVSLGEEADLLQSVVKYYAKLSVKSKKFKYNCLEAKP